MTSPVADAVGGYIGSPTGTAAPLLQRHLQEAMARHGKVYLEGSLLEHLRPHMLSPGDARGWCVVGTVRLINQVRHCLQRCSAAARQGCYIHVTGRWLQSVGPWYEAGLHLLPHACCSSTIQLSVIPTAWAGDRCQHVNAGTCCKLAHQAHESTRAGTQQACHHALVSFDHPPKPTADPAT